MASFLGPFHRVLWSHLNLPRREGWRDRPQGEMEEEGRKEEGLPNPGKDIIISITTSAAVIAGLISQCCHLDILSLEEVRSSFMFLIQRLLVCGLRLDPCHCHVISNIYVISLFLIININFHVSLKHSIKTDLHLFIPRSGFISGKRKAKSPCTVPFPTIS